MSDSSHQLPPAEVEDLLINLPVGVKVNVEKLSNGDVSVLVEAPAPTKEQVIAEKYAHLGGQGITLSQAAEKYGVPRKAIENWVYISHDVHFVDVRCYPKTVDEAEVALCSVIYQERQKMGTAGLPYFDDQGRVIAAVKRPASSRHKK